MANSDNRPTARLGELLTQRGLLQQSDLHQALRKQQQTGTRLGAILLSSGLISRKQLARTLVRQRLLRTVSLIGVLMLAPVTAWSGSSYNYGGPDNIDGYTTPSADRPPIYEGGPISVPVKALVERLAFGITESSYSAKKFRYDIDTLGQGMAFRMRLKF
jgi:hypothetical protein